ncbi:MAG: DUF2804 domain-containing protein [Solirubrobacterales bacterium]
MPLWRARALRKRWRYVGFFSERLMIAAAQVEVGPSGQTFWAVLDRERGELHERTRMRLPGRSTEVWTEGAPLGGEGATRTRVESRDVRIAMRMGAAPWVESISPTAAGGYTWTRKRPTPARCEVTLNDRTLAEAGCAIEDESAGYHPRRTAWMWSAGVGALDDGRSASWNLVTGINDPPVNSERTIWIDGEAAEPAPVRFDSLNGVTFEDGSELSFTSQAERSRRENLVVIRSRYRAPFGSFSGTLPGGLTLGSGLGVMESHEATW